MTDFSQNICERMIPVVQYIVIQVNFMMTPLRVTQQFLFKLIHSPPKKALIA